LVTLETDLDVKLELKTVMDKIRTLSMGKNKETTVSCSYATDFHSHV
jgi:hypothetical protein